MEKRDGVESKILRETDITQRMTVKIQWVGEGKLLPAPIPGSEPIAIPVKDELGNDMVLRLAVRAPKDGEKSYYMKPVFMSKEWRAFVAEKNLKVGESIYLWRDRDYLRIKVRDPPRTHNLFGTNVIC
ncbi:hypothetical protein L484_027893 [Morus notabilis]|uniref:TF-B3 domain-containing protein n=1 Tax=Morus notabilis TaxID=981085 RepID=W9SFF7_9ROSA|nr:hypothetical protein L484_027893 [Morus notabilis]